MPASKKSRPPSRELQIRANAILRDDVSHYQVLGVSPSEVERDTKRALAAARAKIARDFHPDLFVSSVATSAQMAHDVMSRANVAHSVLEDPKTRRVYNLLLAKTHYACFTCKGAGTRRVQRGFGELPTYTPCAACEGDGFLNKETE